MIGDKTKISWCGKNGKTVSPWLGCSKIASGCVNCYAAAMSGRLGVTWGPNGTRRRTAESTWKQVEKWNRKARCTCGRDSAWGENHMPACPQRDRPRVFPSLCDPFEDWGGVFLGSDGSALMVNGNDPSHDFVTMADVRRDFFALINRCQNLDFLLLTKRPENVRRMWPNEYCDGYGNRMDDGDYYGPCRRRNVWLLYSASDQASLEAGLPHLLACWDLVPVLGLSLEPLVGPVDIFAAWGDWIRSKQGDAGAVLDWVIVGGESGPHARPMEIAWLESIAEKCAAAGVPLFVKQDAGPKAGQQGRIPDRFWSIKQFPKG